MIALSEFQDYLQKICRRYEQWWAVDALTETIADRQATFSFEQMVQTEEKKPGEKPEIVSLPILKGIQNYVESEHILLVGSPGVGKSTALLRCLVSFAKDELGKPEPRIPVLVPLKRYNIRFSSSEDPSGMLTLIRDALKPQLRLKISEVEELLFQKRLILLLDGLNEMPADTVRTQLKAFREEYDEIPFICTTRDLGSGDLGIKRRLEAQPPNPLEINRFLRECMPAQAQQVLQLLSRDNRELSRTPFVLWMLYQLFQETGNVVETLGEAFRQFFRSFKKYKEDAPVTDERRKAWNPWLEHLAFTMLDSPEPTYPGLVISDERAEKVLAERFCDLHGASFRIEELLKYHLLERVSEKEVSFHHQLIQEYYAAEYLLHYLLELLKDEESETKLKCHYLNYLKWTEPIAIMLGLPKITKNQAETLIELALDVDLKLGARLAGAVKPEWQEQTVGLVAGLQIPQSLKIQLLSLTKSDKAIPVPLEPVYEKPWTYDIMSDIINLLEQHEYEASVVNAIESLKEGNCSLSLFEEISIDISVFLGLSASPEILTELYKIGLNQTINAKYILDTILAIQSHCGFYNYEIYQQSQETKNLGFEDNFIRNFYKDIDKVISNIQDNPELRQEDKEDRLTIDIVNQLRCLGYDAEHDTKIGGHVDIAVRKGDFLWLGEAKIYSGDNSWLWKGFQQLTTRYSSGGSNQENGGLLIYIRDEDASSIMKKWQNYLLEKSLPDYTFRPCKMSNLAFISTHRHQRSGLAFHVRHIPVVLHFAPEDTAKDKSGRRSKESP